MDRTNNVLQASIHAAGEMQAAIAKTEDERNKQYENRMREADQARAAAAVLEKEAILSVGPSVCWWSQFVRVMQMKERHDAMHKQQLELDVRQAELRTLI